MIFVLIILDEIISNLFWREGSWLHMLEIQLPLPRIV